MTRVILIFGGRSAEHEVSILSARSVANAAPKERLEIVPVCMAKDGRFIDPDRSARILAGDEKSDRGDDDFSFETWLRGAEADIALDIGERVVARHDGKARSGDATTLALRPEDLELAAEAQPGMNNIRGTVVRANYLGAATNAGVRVGETTLVVSIPRGRDVVKEGEPVVVRWRPSAGIMLAGGS